LTAEGSEVRNERAPRGEGRRARGERGEGRRERGERGERINESRPGEGASSEVNTPTEAIVSDGQEAPLSSEASQAENNGERRERRSRDRYGRDRRERGSDSRTDTPNEDDPTDVSAHATPTAAESQNEDRPAARSYFERAQQSAAQTPEVRTEAAVSEAAQVHASVPAEVETSVAPVTAETAAPIAVQAPAVIAEKPAAAPAAPAAMPVAAHYILQIDSLQQVAQGSGLVWVNSDAAKVAAVQAAIAAEPQPVRVPRERPPAVVLSEDPLVLVETRKDLKDMSLPF
jgi:ribonuclease E